MSKIVVAIDFSGCSINAFCHALTIAQHCDSELILVWVEKSLPEKVPVDKKAGDAPPDVKKAFEDLIGKYQPEYPGVSIAYTIRVGKIYKEVTAEARSCNAMLIVAGTHGASGFEEFWIGSNANRIISSSQCPVITIRGGIDIRKPLSRIVFPIDSSEETRQKASFVSYLAKKHSSEVFILKLYTSKMKTVRQNIDLYASQVTRFFDEEKVKFRVDQVDDVDNLSNATIDFARSIDASLIAIMTEQQTTTANILLGPYAHQTVNHSPIPVLSIHSMETYAVGQGF